MYVYMYVHVCIKNEHTCMYICVYVTTCMYVCMYMYV